MTREEAINKLIRIRQQQGDKSEAHEALGMAIDALAYQTELPEDLEEAAFTYENDLWESGFKDCSYSPQEVNDAFKAGAEWQKKQDLAEMAQSKSPLSVAYANRCFENGKQAMKEQMLKKAVEGGVSAYDNGKIRIYTELLDGDIGLHFGDKVKVIIVK